MAVLKQMGRDEEEGPFFLPGSGRGRRPRRRVAIACIINAIIMITIITINIIINKIIIIIIVIIIITVIIIDITRPRKALDAEGVHGRSWQTTSAKK